MATGPIVMSSTMHTTAAFTIIMIAATWTARFMTAGITTMELETAVTMKITMAMTTI